MPSARNMWGAKAIATAPSTASSRAKTETLRNRATHPSGVAGRMCNRNRRGNGAKRAGGELIDDRVQVADHHPGRQRLRIEVGHQHGVGDRHREIDEPDKRNRAGGPGEDRQDRPKSPGEGSDGVTAERSS